MARTSHTLNYHRSGNTYSCRSYTYDHPATGFQLAFRVGDQNCYLPGVAPSSTYASHLRFQFGTMTLAIARLVHEYKSTWSPFLSVAVPAGNGYSTKTSSTTFDYDMVYSPTSMNNLLIVINAGLGGNPSIPGSYNIDGIDYLVTLKQGSNYFYHRLGTPGAGNGISKQITIYGYYFVSPGPDPDPPVWYSTTAYRVEP